MLLSESYVNLTSERDLECPVRFTKRSILWTYDSQKIDINRMYHLIPCSHS